MKKIVVIGSTNTDMVVKSERIPVPGETILGGRFLMNPGGKGANQAVAAARLEGDVTFIAKVGDDLFGREARALFQKERIDTSHLLTDPDNPSGVALIMVDAKGENCISVASGANASLSPRDLEAARNVIEAADVLLMQLETPVETVLCAARWAAAKGRTVILNPAPAAALPPELFPCLALITPNETEAELLTGIRVDDGTSARKAARKIVRHGGGSRDHHDGFARLVPVPGRPGRADSGAAGQAGRHHGGRRYFQRRAGGRPRGRNGAAGRDRPRLPRRDDLRDPDGGAVLRSVPPRMQVKRGGEPCFSSKTTASPFFSA